MKQKKNPRFRFSGSIDMEIIRRQVKRHRRSVLGQWTIRIVVAAMIVTGTYLVIENQTYTSVATADSHKKDTEDSNQYIAFSPVDASLMTRFSMCFLSSLLLW